MSEEEEPEREAVRECYAELCKRMDPKGLRRRLFSEGLLTDEQNGAVQDLQNTSDKNEKLLVAIRQRSGKDIVLFCKILFEEKQEHCGDLLMNGLKKYKIDISDLQRFKKTSRPPVPAHRVPQYMYRLQQLDTPFASLVTSVKKAVVTCEDFSTWSISLLTALKARSPHNEKVENAIVNIQDSSSEDKIFTYLQPFFDPIDVRLIENLIELLVEDSQVDQESESKRRLQVHDVQEKLHSYKSKVEDACTITLSKCKKDIVNDERPKNGMYVGFQTSLEPEVVTVNKILNLKEYLVDDIGVEEALFEGFSCSNVSLFFSIKLERLAFLIHWCYLHRRDFIEKFNVTLVFVPGHFVYSMEADQEYPFPKVCSVAKHGQSSKHVDPQGFVAQETSHLMNGLGQMLDEIVTERLDKRLADIETKTDVLTNTQMAIAQKQRLREDDLLGRILSLQKLAGSMTTDIVGEPKGSMQKVQVNFEKVLDRLNSLERVVEEGRESKKSPGFSSTSLDEVSDDLSMKIEKHKAMLEDFGAQFRVLGEDVISKVGEEVKKKLHAMEEPFQVYAGQILGITYKINLFWLLLYFI
jgi:predicted nuclease with TOPRIM domain